MSVSVTTEAEAVAYAVGDLAKELGVPGGNIKVLERGVALWPDASLGLPEPGMMYAQVMTEGFHVLLEAGGKKYVYHFGDGSVRKRPL